MTAPSDCPNPIAIHGESGAWECVDSLCTYDRQAHTSEIPCRWSWPYAHGKAWGGRPFPSYRCLNCAHISRSGKPDIEVAVQQRAPAPQAGRATT